MEDPTLEADESANEIIAELRLVRLWRSEQRAKHGMQWKDDAPPGCSDFEKNWLPARQSTAQ